MPKYYCDYCDIFLTHDSASVRKAHIAGWKHALCVRNYYADLPPEILQGQIDRLMKQYEGKPLPQSLQPVQFGGVMRPVGGMPFPPGGGNPPYQSAPQIRQAMPPPPFMGRGGPFPPSQQYPPHPQPGFNGGYRPTMTPTGAYPPPPPPTASFLPPTANFHPPAANFHPPPQ